MANAKLTAPVGDSKRPVTDKAPKVGNKPADIQLVQQMLKWNGFGVKVTGKVDAGLLKAIRAAQTKLCGMKKPDGVVDPNGKTFKAMLPKYLIMMKELEKKKLYYIKYKGKDCYVEEDDYKRIKQDVVRTAMKYHEIFDSQFKLNEKIWKEYNETAQMKKGIMNAVTQALIVTVGSVKMADVKILNANRGALTDLYIACAQGDLKAIEKALPKAEKATNAFYKEMKRFLNEFTRSASTTATVLNVTATVGFAIVGAMAAPVIVSAAGVSMATATIAAGVGVAVLESGAKEFGKHVAGQKVTVWESVQAVAIDGTIGLITAGISTKLPVKFVDDFAGAVSNKVAQRFTYLSGESAKKLIKTYLAEGGGEAIKETMSQVVKIIGNMAKTGKTPTEKDFKAAFQEIMFKTLSAGMLKNLKGFEAKWAVKNRNLVSSKIVPDRMAHLLKNNELPKMLHAKVLKDVASKVNENVAKIGFDAAVGKITGNESADKIAKVAEKEVLNNKEVQRIIDKAITEALKKNKVPLK